ncbi:OmpA family protein [Streptomyces sp. NPDC047000]|uniref:OmpA family protein n=1 Tax=Streptomyces sp. NPDC047000 TaxID=3155474 RepID=UPI0033EFA7D1
MTTTPPPGTGPAARPTRSAPFTRAAWVVRSAWTHRSDRAVPSAETVRSDQAAHSVPSVPSTPRVSRRVHPVRAVGTVLLLPALVAGLLTGCAPGPGSQAQCGWMRKGADSASPATEGQTVVLVDVSSSVRGSTPASGGVDDSDAVGQRLGTWLDGVGTVSVAAFGGDAHDLRWTARNWATRPPHGNEDNWKRRTASVPGCVATAVAGAQASVPGRGGSDVLGAVREASTVLAGTEGTRRLVVLTDGLPTTGCADLRGAGFEEKAETDAIVQRCRDEKEVTSRTLLSVETVFVGLGRTAQDAPQASPAQSEWLAGLWQGLCAAAHPEPAHGPDCALITVAATRQSGGKASPRRPHDPAVEFPERTYRQAGARALFDPDSAVLRPAALPRLTRIAVDLRGLDGARVRVLGYVDPRGGSANNRKLSQARADAVKSELERLGVRRVTAVGKGVPDGCPGAAGDLGKEQKLQCDRRVDIVVVR